MPGFHYFGCREKGDVSTADFKNGLWTITCPACGVVTKLKPDPERRHAFVVSGAFLATPAAARAAGTEAP